MTEQSRGGLEEGEGVTGGGDCLTYDGWGWWSKKGMCVDGEVCSSI